MSKQNKRVVRHVLRDEFIWIDPETDCNRCGEKVNPELPRVVLSDGHVMRVCEKHCVGCEETSEKPNTLADWREAPDLPLFKGPICPSCLEGRRPREFFGRFSTRGEQVEGETLWLECSDNIITSLDELRD